MRRALLSKVAQCSTKFLSPPTAAPPTFSLLRTLRQFSSDETTSPPLPNPDPVPATSPEVALGKQVDSKDVSEDVGNEVLKTHIEKYFDGEEEELSSILESILSRKLSKKHEETDDELLEELRHQPVVTTVHDEEFESDFEDVPVDYKESYDLYNARELVEKRIKQDPYFNMDDKKWDEMVQEGIQHGYLRDTRECEDILEDMLKWDNLLPDDIKKKVEVKFNELGDMCERQELEPEEAYERFKEFEDEIVAEYLKQMEAEGPPQLDKEAEQKNEIGSDDPPGEGPILRWQTRVVFAPGGDAWHPKNRKVKLSVTVGELGLSKYQFKRMRVIVGKRYHPGRDELTITSERFEEREENRKDCLRTLFNIIEEAGKGNEIVDEARTHYVKCQLKRDSAFMARLRAKTKNLHGSSSPSL